MIDQSGQRARIALGTALALLGLFAAVVLLSGRLTPAPAPAASGRELKLEDAYNRAYAAGMQQFAVDSGPYSATSAGPGACQAGSSKQACLDTDAAVIGDLNQLLTRLGALPVPARYVQANRLLRQALTETVAGLKLRDSVLASPRGGSLAASNAELKQAFAVLSAAYAAFPADHRPLPAPH